MSYVLSHLTAQVGSLRGGDCEWEGDPGQHDPGWHGSRLLFPGPGHKNESNNKLYLIRFLLQFAINYLCIFCASLLTTSKIVVCFANTPT